MKIHALIFTSGILSCTMIFAQDSILFDTIHQDINLIIEYSEPKDAPDVDMNDSIKSETEPDTVVTLAHDTGICVSIPVVIEWPSTIYPVVTFTDSPITLPWSWGSWSVPYEPPTMDDWIIEAAPYRRTMHRGFFDTTPLRDSSAFVYYETEQKQVSAIPPAKTPEPAKPVPLPEQPWYQALLPTPIRIRKG